MEAMTSASVSFQSNDASQSSLVSIHPAFPDPNRVTLPVIIILRETDLLLQTPPETPAGLIERARADLHRHDHHAAEDNRSDQPERKHRVPSTT
jgi:hypothetical protein